MTGIRKQFTAEQARESSGATKRQLYHWIDKGMIKASKEGGDLMLTREEVKILELMRSLVDLGFSPGVAEEYARSAIFVTGAYYEYVDSRMTLRWTVR